MEDNLARVRAGFEAFNRGDMEEVLRFLHPDVEVFASEEVGEPGSYRGRDAFLSWNRTWMDAWEDFRVDTFDFEPMDDHNVLVHVTQSARGRGSGVEVSQNVTYLFTLHDGLASRLHLYPDRESALAAARS